MDSRIAEAQATLWEVDVLRRLGAGRRARKGLMDLARLHQEIAFDRLGQNDPDGWIDLYAAVSAYGEAGEKARARDCLERARGLTIKLPQDAREEVVRELDQHARWLDDLMVLPSLTELALPVSVPPPLVAA